MDAPVALYSHAARPRPHRVLLVCPCDAERLQYATWLRRLDHLVIACAGTGEARMHLLQDDPPLDLVVLASCTHGGLKTGVLHRTVEEVHGDRIPVLAAPGRGKAESSAYLAGRAYHAWHLPPFGDWPAFERLVAKALALRRLLQFGDGVQVEIERRLAVLTARLLEQVYTLEHRVRELQEERSGP